MPRKDADLIAEHLVQLRETESLLKKDLARVSALRLALERAVIKAAACTPPTAEAPRG